MIAVAAMAGVVLIVALGWLLLRRNVAPGVGSKEVSEGQQTTNQPTTGKSNQPPPANPQRANKPAAAGNLGFVIQIRSVDKMVIIKTRVDDQDMIVDMLKPGDVKEFKPTQTFSIRYAKSLANALELTINGRPAKVVVVSATNPVEMVITKDDYEKFLQ